MPETVDSEQDQDGAAVTTGTGDDGYTSLLGPERVPKYSPRPNAFGTLDEASSALGLGRAMCRDREVQEVVHELQRGLYKAMAELATPPESYEKVQFKMTAQDVERLDQISNDLKQRVTIGREFIVPGGTACGAALDLARTIIRRGERLVVRLMHSDEVTNPHIVQWLNRLSDTVFILARYCEADESSNDSEGATSRS